MGPAAPKREASLEPGLLPPRDCGCFTCETRPLGPCCPPPMNTSRQGVGTVTGHMHAVARALGSSWFWAEVGAAAQARVLHQGCFAVCSWAPLFPRPGGLCGDTVSHQSEALGTQR